MLDWITGKNNKIRKDFGKYNFHIKSQPEFIDSSTTLTLTTYTNSSQTATIPCRYKWSIIKNNLTIQVPQFKGSSFKCEPADVGAIIQAEVISTDAQYGGSAIIHFGPVKIDVTLKKQIQIALSSGCATLPIYLCSNGEQKQCQIRLFEDLIKINHTYSQTNYTFDYSMFQPRVQCVSKDSCRVIIMFNQKYQVQLKKFMKRLFQQPVVKDLNSSGVKSTNSSNLIPPQVNKLDIKFMNRNQRDIFLFVMKAFNTKKQLRSSVILTKIQQVDFGNQQTFDYLLQIQSLKSELVKMDAVMKKSYQQKFIYIEEVKRLQKQIQQIIITYTRIVEEKFQNQAQLSRDYSMLSTKRDQILNKKYKNLQNQNNHLNSRIQTLTKQIDVIRFKPQNPSNVQPIQSMQPHVPFIPSNQQFMPQQQFGQQRLYLNYEQNPSPFIKKQSLSQSNVIGNILDELGQSRISYISQNKQDLQMKAKIDSLQKQKQQLQRKLQKSFHKIDDLEKDLFMKQQVINQNNQSHLGNQTNQYIPSQQYNQANSGHKMNQSAVHFTYKGGVNDSLINYTQPLNYSMVVDKQKQNLVVQNSQLKKSNQKLKVQKQMLRTEKQVLRTERQILKSQRQKLINQLKSSRKVSPAQKSVVIKSSQVLDNSLNFLKTQKKESSISEKQKDLIQTLSKKDSQIKLLKMQNQELKKLNQKLKRINQQMKKQLQSNKSSSSKCQKLQKKVLQLEEQIQMYRKNSDALNRSQQLSMEMQNYNQQQINMLKQHNQFLTSQNQKLSKACQRYMTQAKQSNKLRLQIIKLKQRINQLQALNTSHYITAH